MSDIPVVFSMVQDPAASGIIASMRSSENNFTGSSSDISAFFVFDSIRTIFPKTQRIGVIYDPLRSGAKITEAKMAAELLGMTLVGEPVRSYKMVPEVARSLIDRIDVLWIMPDPTVVTKPSLEYIFVRMLWSKKMIVGYDPYIVKAGALLCKNNTNKLKSQKNVEFVYTKIKNIEKTHIPGRVNISNEKKIIV